MTGIEENKLDGSFKLFVAKLLAVVCAWKTKSSQLDVMDKTNEPPLVIPDDDTDDDDDEWVVGVAIRRNNSGEEAELEDAIWSGDTDGCSCWNDRVGWTKAKAKGISDAAIVNNDATILFVW